MIISAWVNKLKRVLKSIDNGNVEVYYNSINNEDVEIIKNKGREYYERIKRN